LGIVESGRAEITLGNRTQVLEPGDSLSFAADAPHVLVNGGTETLKVFWVITPPKGGELTEVSS
jgi:mannose-6-phosphate isomerase-like protein (cupin superfamily)